MKSRLHHVALGARDVRRVAAFYAEAFHLTEVERFEDAQGVRSIWLELVAGAVLMIERAERERIRPEGIDAGPFLLAFREESAALEVAVLRLAGLGAQEESRTAHSVYFRDPEGNRVALSVYHLPSAEP